MSTSFQNDTFMSNGTEPEDVDMDDEREGETNPDSVEEYVWNLMGKTGLLSEIKSRIALFVQENGRLLPGVSVIPSRADPVILSHIFEYLQWVGMKNTASLLLSESPFKVQTTPLRVSEEPALCALFEKTNKELLESVHLDDNKQDIPINSDTRVQTPLRVSEEPALCELFEKSNKDLLESVHLDDNTQDIPINSDSRVQTPLRVSEEPALCALFEKTNTNLLESVHLDDNTQDISIDSDSRVRQSQTPLSEEPALCALFEKTNEDLLESIDLDDNTQDISIDSDSRGISSCEHVVNLK